MIFLMFAPCTAAGSLLCDFSESRRTPRCVEQARGNDGYVTETKCFEKETVETVGSVKGNGIMPDAAGVVIQLKGIGKQFAIYCM